MLMHEYAPTDHRPAPARFSAAVPAGGEGLARIRRDVRAWLAARGVTDEAETAVLLVNELVTNAQQHASGPARLRLFLRAGLLRCEVLDAHPSLPELCRPDDGDEDGRGLALVEALALRWGAIAAGRGKVVWFDLMVRNRG